jgi:hypothetical protein
MLNFSHCFVYTTLGIQRTGKDLADPKAEAAAVRVSDVIGWLKVQ